MDFKKIVALALISAVFTSAASTDEPTDFKNPAYEPLSDWPRLPEGTQDRARVGGGDGLGRSRVFLATRGATDTGVRQRRQVPPLLGRRVAENAARVANGRERPCHGRRTSAVIS